MVIIDGHTHISSRVFKQSDIGIQFDWNDLNRWLLSKPKNKCVVMPVISQFCDSVSLNIEMFNELENFPQKNRVLPFLWIHPTQLKEDHFKKFNFSGFKFHPSISQETIDLSEKMLGLCEKHKKPILVHCGRNEKSRIDYVLDINERYPNLDFVCAHLGGLATDLVVRAFKKISETSYLDNIFLETSGCLYPKLIKKAVEILGADRIIFGSDRPFHDYKVSLYSIKCCNFDKETEQSILFGNLSRIIG